MRMRGSRKKIRTPVPEAIHPSMDPIVLGQGFHEGPIITGDVTITGTGDRWGTVLEPRIPAFGPGTSDNGYSVLLVPPNCLVQLDNLAIQNGQYAGVYVGSGATLIGTRLWIHNNRKFGIAGPGRVELYECWVGQNGDSVNSRQIDCGYLDLRSCFVTDVGSQGPLIRCTGGPSAYNVFAGFDFGTGFTQANRNTLIDRRPVDGQSNWNIFNDASVVATTVIMGSDSTAALKPSGLTLEPAKQLLPIPNAATGAGAWDNQAVPAGYSDWDDYRCSKWRPGGSGCAMYAYDSNSPPFRWSDYPEFAGPENQPLT